MLSSSDAHKSRSFCSSWQGTCCKLHFSADKSLSDLHRKGVGLQMMGKVHIKCQPEASQSTLCGIPAMQRVCRWWWHCWCSENSGRCPDLRPQALSSLRPRAIAANLSRRKLGRCAPNIIFVGPGDHPPRPHPRPAPAEQAGAATDTSAGPSAPPPDRLHV